MGVEITPIVSSPKPVPRYSGTAILAFPTGLLGVFLPTPFGMLVGGIAVLLAGAARRELKREEGLRGTSLAVMGFLLGAGVLAVQALPLLQIFVLMAAALLGF